MVRLLLCSRDSSCLAEAVAEGVPIISFTHADLLGMLLVCFPCCFTYDRQVPVSKRSHHISTLMRQLADWALSPVAPAAAAASTAAAADSTASHMAAQLQLQDSSPLLPTGTSPAAAAAVAAVTGGGWDACKARQQALLQLPLDASEEGVLVAVLRERMAGGQAGGHLLPLYFLQVSLLWVCVLGGVLC
jgi:hypothetical protein